MATAAIAVPKRSREYETIYVLRPDVTRENQERIANRVGEAVTRESGKLTNLENWGRRQLAYTVRKYRRGVYVYVRYVGGGPLVSEIERNLRMLDDVLKYQTVQVATEIDLETVEVKPENVAFESVEPATEAELDEPIERLLGLEQSSDRGERQHRSDEDDFEANDAPDDEEEAT